MKIPTKAVLFLFAILILFSHKVVISSFAQTNETIYFFYGQGCPHCANVETFFEQAGTYDHYTIEKKEIYFNQENQILFNQMLDERDVPIIQRGVPMLIIGNTTIVGDIPIVNYFANQFTPTPTSSISPTPEPTVAPFTEPETKGTQSTDLTLWAVIAAALVDAINPCAFAVLIILLTTILIKGKAKDALLSGFAFSSSIFLSYLAMGLGLYKAISLGNFSITFYQIIGWFAVVLGFFNLKDWLWYGKGFLMEVPQSWRPQLKQVLGSVTNPVGAFTVGFLVSLFLLPCTSGPYIVILGMLAQKTELLKAISYLILYNLIFVSPMIAITIAVFKGLDPQKVERIRQQRLKTLHLIAGIILITMGIYIIVFQ